MEETRCCKPVEDMEMQVMKTVTKFPSELGYDETEQLFQRNMNRIIDRNFVS